jgi:hypothetical protein
MSPGRDQPSLTGIEDYDVFCNQTATQCRGVRSDLGVISGQWVLIQSRQSCFGPTGPTCCHQAGLGCADGQSECWPSSLMRTLNPSPSMLQLAP